MKQIYSQPRCEQLEELLSFNLLDDSLVGNYSGEDAIPEEGIW